MVVLSDDDLADGEAPDVIVIESTAGDLVDELIDNQWPQSAVLFVGETSWDRWGSKERLIGAVSNSIDAARLSTAVLAMAVGLVVIDPELSALLPFAVQQEPNDQPDVLTPRERQVLELVARGYPNKTIAYELGISEHTAKFHVGSLLTKLDASSRTEVVTNATRRGLLTV
jgi:DNA-binding NarL/FixJ family response regulator